ncbi:MAG: GNAT family N-acetyltransferase [Candidatus Micrarchaeota archaeon]|nr:GNAT family N-acetyltransferase [Candidatus Micrarchaeota archaeon]
MEIRKATEKDIPGMIGLWVCLIGNPRFNPYLKRYGLKKNCVQLYRKFLKSRIRARNAAVFVAEAKGELVGEIIVSIEKHPPVYVIDREGSVNELFVKAGYRGKGIGTKLLTKALEWCKARKLREFGLTVHVCNKKARSVYRKFGLEEVSLKMDKIIAYK